MTHPLLEERFQVITDFPGNTHIVGALIEHTPEDLLPLDKWNTYFKDFPGIFNPVPWYVNRTLDEMVSVKYVRVHKYVGYWRVGDVVEVIDYVITKGKFIAYTLEYTNVQTPDTVLPATEEEYKQFKATKL